MQSTHSITVQQRGDKIQRYESKNSSDLIIEEDIAGLDANVLVDLIESDEFKQNIREQVSFGVWKIYTTNIALGEARHVLIKKRRYTHEDATNKIQNLLKEFNIIKIDHNGEGNELGNKWVNFVKSKILIKKFSTFPNDCRILANLFKHVKVNIYFTEDQDLEKAVNILKVPIRIRVVGEASQLDNFEIKRFFKEQFKEKRRAFHKSRKRR
ncbi:type II toxin-antitoxin system VapC family toxin [Candidatus Pacearchaeota archaeon]|nr:type II toxin-antitoxin system VapC family toxin [Candidatus Pacearchaeota archaeon]